MHVGVHKVLMNSPSDVSGLDRLIDAGADDRKEIVALIGKTEGNGGANDFTRGFATLSFSLALARRLGVSADEVAKRVAFVHDRWWVMEAPTGHRFCIVRRQRKEFGAHLNTWP